MLLQHEMNEPSFSDKIPLFSTWTAMIEMWIGVLGFVLIGMVVLLWRELERLN